MSTNKQIAERIVDNIIRDLSDRRGLHHEWEQIDDDIQEEIKQVWIKETIDELIKG